MVLHAAAIFLGAFLLFQLEPILAKLIHPWFGGSAAIWTICLLFFQTGLLAGYLYVDWLAGALRPRTQSLVHLALLAASLLTLPVLPGTAWKPDGAEHPALRIVGLLAVTGGLPYFLLATTSPLMQVWHWRRTAGKAPYRLYAVANLASLCALLAYPFLIEPNIATGRQARLWSWSYAAYAVLAAVAALRGGRDPVPASPSAGVATPWRERLSWMGLAALPSLLLLASTNFLTESIASVPFLWLAPLSLYLLSFVLCFGWERCYVPGVYFRLLPVALIAMAYFFWEPKLIVHHRTAIAVYSIGLFLCAMFAHGELARRKPEPCRLTSFYIWVALGGALGGLLVAVAAPLVFSGPFELPLILTAAGAALAILALGRSRRLAAIAAAVALFLAVTAVHYVRSFRAGAPVAVRNFYGSLRVMDLPSARANEPIRMLVHGTVDHGRQFLNPALRRLPTTYYGPESGIGLVLSRRRGPARLGVIGLGTGTLATYARPGDSVRFYEVNPAVIRLARECFTFLADCRASVQVVTGDGRLSLEREPPQQFDVLAVDAFSAGAIPVHLLSREAFAVYFRHLRHDGVLALNITSAGLDLAPVIARAAEAFAVYGVLVHHQGSPEQETCLSSWALLSRDASRLTAAELARAAAPLRTRPGVRLWTDDYSNLLAVLK
jgi:hypothetical protein